jgi:hypothetical protein
MWVGSSTAITNFRYLLSSTYDFTGLNIYIQHMTIHYVHGLVTPLSIQFNDDQMTIPIAAPAIEPVTIVTGNHDGAIGSGQYRRPFWFS